MVYEDFFLRDGRWIWTKQDENQLYTDTEFEVRATFGPGWCIENSGTVVLSYRGAKDLTKQLGGDHRPATLTDHEFYRIHVRSGKVIRVEHLFTFGWEDVDYLFIEAGSEILRMFHRI